MANIPCERAWEWQHTCCIKTRAINTYNLKFTTPDLSQQNAYQIALYHCGSPFFKGYREKRHGRRIYAKFIPRFGKDGTCFRDLGKVVNYWIIFVPRPVGDWLDLSSGIFQEIIVRNFAKTRVIWRANMLRASCCLPRSC